MVSAVLAVDSDDVVDAVARAEAVSKVRGSADFESISSAFKRMKNILRQAAEKTNVIAHAGGCLWPAGGIGKATGGDDPANRSERWKNCAPTENYEAALLEIAKLRPAIDKFFDKVMVMVEDEQSARQPAGVCCRPGQGILHDRGFFRDRD